MVLKGGMNDTAVMTVQIVAGKPPLIVPINVKPLYNPEREIKIERELCFISEACNFLINGQHNLFRDATIASGRNC